MCARLLVGLELLRVAFASTEYGRDLVHADLAGTVSNVTIEGFTFGGCFSADIPAGALGSNYTVSTLTESSPSACADACVDWEAFLVGAGNCYCVEPSEFALSAWQQLEETLCDAPCDAWGSDDFGGLVAYFSILPGFCGGNLEAFSFYEAFDAVNAVGQGTLDRDRGLWYQVVLVQTLLGGPPEHAGLFEDGSWRWRLHASSAITGRAAFPLHRDLDEPIVGLVMDYMEGQPSVLGTSYSGSVYSASAGSRNPVQLLVDSASYPGHTVDDATVEPGAAPVLTFDQDRRVLFATQPIGGEDSSLYALELDAPNDMPYRHMRFTPSCNSTWCAVNEIRFRYQEVEIDLSSATTYFLHDLSDPQLRNGAILVDFPAPVYIDEFSFSMPYNNSANAPSRWVLEGTNDRVRRCILNGAPDYQAMGDGTYAQRNGETRYGRSVYRDSSGGIIYFDDTSASWCPAVS
ncbi:petA [Symbiodinium natans]|uniref:PetA protein n=1 Tax=Symbiodinium natans TaxID=878477 RepID=A0A812G8F9_9DINO|nr:petA [Symbiodinium natans]